MIFWKLFRVFGKGENEKNMTELSTQGFFQTDHEDYPVISRNGSLCFLG